MFMEFGMDINIGKFIKELCQVSEFANVLTRKELGVTCVRYITLMYHKRSLYRHIDELSRHDMVVRELKIDPVFGDIFRKDDDAVLCAEKFIELQRDDDLNSYESVCEQLRRVSKRMMDIRLVDVESTDEVKQLTETMKKLTEMKTMLYAIIIDTDNKKEAVFKAGEKPGYLARRNSENLS